MKQLDFFTGRRWLPGKFHQQHEAIWAKAQKKNSETAVQKNVNQIIEQ